jgi:serine/threonine protein kinase
VLKALLDIRVRLPPIFYIHPKLILVDTVSYECKIIVDHEMFKRESERPQNDFSIDNLRYLSPEEIKNQHRELTTPSWIIGCMMYEAHFKKCAFQTHLNGKVMMELIKSYPVQFPRSMMIKFDADLNDTLSELLEKDHTQRLGSEKCEAEILESYYFMD